MGISNDDHDLEMDNVRTSRDEESLPLYSEVGGKEPTEVPGPTATPDAVREFFVTLLITKRQDSPDDAQTIAALWKGTGRELKAYPPAMYLQIFGPEDGWFLYKETQLVMRRPKEDSPPASKAWSYAFLAFMIAFELGMIAIAMWSGSAGWTTFAIIAGLFGFFMLIGAFALCFESSDDLEKRIEDELKKCLEGGGNQNGAK